MKSEREERLTLENRIYSIIMDKKNYFTIKELIEDLTRTVPYEIDYKKILDVVYDAIEFCLSEGIIDFVDSYSYMVNPAKQAELYKIEEDVAEC